jgi:hypothetical protein
MGPRAEEPALHAEAGFAEPDDLYVARVRAEFETRKQVSGPPDAHDYQYPEHLTGPSAASYPPPAEPEADGIEPGT